MGKYIGLILFIVIFGGVIVFVVVNAIKRREEAFEGTVIDKDVVETQNMNNMNNMGRPGVINIGNRGNYGGGVQHTYRIKVQTTAGKTINYKVSEGKYEIIKIGDKVSKPKGTTEVNIISSAPAQPVAAPINSVSPTNVTPTVPPVIPVIPVTPVSPAPTVTPTTPTPAPPTQAGPPESFA